MITQLKTGDIIQNQYGKRKVLGVCGEVYFLSKYDVYDVAQANYYFTLRDINDNDYTLVQQELQDGDEYWYINTIGNINLDVWDNTQIDQLNTLWIEDTLPDIKVRE